MDKITTPTISCESCNTPLETLKLCSQCLEIGYCNKTCQTNAWPEHILHCGLDSTALALAGTELQLNTFTELNRRVNTHIEELGLQDLLASMEPEELHARKQLSLSALIASYEAVLSAMNVQHRPVFSSIIAQLRFLDNYIGLNIGRDAVTVEALEQLLRSSSSEQLELTAEKAFTVGAPLSRYGFERLLNYLGILASSMKVVSITQDWVQISIIAAGVLLLFKYIGFLVAGFKILLRAVNWIERFDNENADIQRLIKNYDRLNAALWSNKPRSEIESTKLKFRSTIQNLWPGKFERVTTQSKKALFKLLANWAENSFDRLAAAPSAAQDETEHAAATLQLRQRQKQRARELKTNMAIALRPFAQSYAEISAMQPDLIEETLLIFFFQLATLPRAYQTRQVGPTVRHLQQLASSAVRRLNHRSLETDLPLLTP